MRFLILYIIMCCSLNGAAQFSDDFSDLELFNGPKWFGDTANFKVDQQSKLQLEAPAMAAKSFLVTPCPVSQKAEWSFTFQMGFNPSSSNQAKVYLCSDKETLTDSLNGYYVLIGGANDEIALYRQNGKSTSKLIDGPNKMLDHDQNGFPIRITYDSTRTWKVYVDTLNSGAFSLIGEKQDATVFSSSWFGLVCEYTQTRSDKFWFDDITVNGVQELDPPTILSIEVDGLSTVMIKFSEAIRHPGKESFVVNGMYPDSVDGVSNELSLYFPAQGNGTEGRLTLSGIQDVAGNSLVDTSISLLFLVGEKLEPEDLLIAEIMFDPSPTVGLPDAEFIELYNNSDKVVDLADLIYKNSGKAHAIKRAAFFPDTYILLCAVKDTSRFKGIRAIGLESWSALSNSGDSLSIESIDSVLVSEVNYELEWQTADKASGGWSLEMKRISGSCPGEINYGSSIDSTGGTPGRANSILDNSLDNSGPSITSKDFHSDTLIIRFDEALFGAGSAYSIPDNTVVVEKWVDDTQLNLKINFATDSLNILVIEGYSDCRGNVITADTVVWFNYSSPGSGDIIFTEIMADPTPAVGLPDAEYLELYNRSEKTVDLFHCKLNQYEITEHIYLPAKGFAIVLDQSKAELFSDSLLLIPLKLGSSFLSNEGKELRFTDPTGDLLSSVAYNSSWYGSGSHEGGVSLELLDPLSLCPNSSVSWAASSSVDGGSPGYLNADQELPQGKALVMGFSYFRNDSVYKEFNQPIIRVGSWSIDPPLVGFKAFLDDKQRLNLVLPGINNADYTLRGDSIQGCLDEQFRQVEFHLSRPKEPSSLIINELLYDPIGNGSDFIELYNPGKDYLDLSGLEIRSKPYDDGVSIDSLGLLLEPHGYLLLTEDTSAIRLNYPGSRTERFLPFHLPNFTNEEGYAGLWIDSLLVDELTYNNAMHHRSLKETEGVSLERDWTIPDSIYSSTWSSASATTFYASPGYANSIHSQDEEGSGLKLSCRLISDNGDGHDDQLEIELSVNDGLSGSITIYNKDGLPVEELMRQEPISGTRRYQWPRADKLPEQGVYLVVLELFGEAGMEKIQKEVVVYSR